MKDFLKSPTKTLASEFVGGLEVKAETMPVEHDTWMGILVAFLGVTISLGWNQSGKIKEHCALRERDR